VSALSLSNHAESKESLWVALVARVSIREALVRVKVDVLMVSNDCTRARRAVDLWQVDLERGVEVASAVVRVPAVGFIEGDLESAGALAGVEVVLRFDVEGQEAPGTKGAGQVVAVVPVGAATAFIASQFGGFDPEQRFVCVGVSCPLHLSWAN